MSRPWPVVSGALGLLTVARHVSQQPEKWVIAKKKSAEPLFENTATHYQHFALDNFLRCLLPTGSRVERMGRSDQSTAQRIQRMRNKLSTCFSEQSSDEEL